MVRQAHDALVAQQRDTGLEIPQNRSAGVDRDEDRILRFLDCAVICAVIRHLHAIVEDSGVDDQAIAPFDTVRGMFTEGGQLYPGGGFRERSHVQNAVRNMDCVKGIFFPR